MVYQTPWVTHLWMIIMSFVRAFSPLLIYWLLLIIDNESRIIPSMIRTELFVSVLIVNYADQRPQHQLVDCQKIIHHFV